MSVFLSGAIEQERQGESTPWLMFVTEVTRQRVKWMAEINREDTFRGI